MSVTSVTDENFETEVLNSDQPVLVDFWAEWCGPCKQMLPVVDQLSEELSNVKVVKVNIEENPETPTRYGVRGIPTFMVFKGGELVDAISGVRPKPDMTDWVTSKTS
jgi:thioredoxin 1